MKINVIAIDDEPLALELISTYIKKTPDLNLRGLFDNPMNSLEVITGEKIDIIFLDIQMPDITGTRFSRLLPPGPRVIFTTAHEQYALEGFKLEAIDYLLKPFSYEEFTVAVNKARRLFELESNAAGQVSANEEFLFIKSEYKIRRINFSDILYIESMKDYVKIYSVSEPKPLLSISSMKAMELKLPEGRFMRVHRSYIVNLEHVNTIERNRIIFGKERIPVGDQYKEKFQKFLNENFL